MDEDGFNDDNDNEDDDDDLSSSRQDSFNSGSSISISINPNPSSSQDDFEEEQEDRGYLVVSHPRRNPPSSLSGVIDPYGQNRTTATTAGGSTRTTVPHDRSSAIGKSVNGGVTDVAGTAGVLPSGGATVAHAPRTSTIVNDQRHARKKVVFDYDIDIARL